MQRIIPPAWFVAAVLLMAGLHLALPGWSVILPQLRIGGGVFVAAGLLLVLWPAVLFRRARTPIKPFTTSTALVTSGPFRFSRNPIYLGMFMVLLGGAVRLGSLTPFAVCMAFPVLIDRVFIVHEERLLVATFGEPYERYCHQVRRWIGRKRLTKE